MSLAIGAGAGACAIVFQWPIKTFTYLLSGHADYSEAHSAANPFVPGLGRWFVIVAPVVAGLLYGPLVYFFAREARGHGVPEVMYAVARRGGRIGPQVAAVKALASALCIGGGARSAGRAPSCRSAPRSRPPSVAWSGPRKAECGCSSPAAPREASPRPSTPRSPASSSRWN